MATFRQFIVKLHSRCNLRCDYCYVYTKADQRWRNRPRVMSTPVIDHTVRRVAEYVAACRLDDIEVVLHGGEPLLAGVNTIEYLIKRLRTAVPARVNVSIQTNAILLDRAFLTLFRELDVLVGVSIDGDAVANDRHRIRPTGEGSHAEVAAALRELAGAEFRSSYGGLLCTIDLANDPVRTYEALLGFAPPAIDFLLPHGNWTSPPPGRMPGTPETPYADWLLAVFDRWYAAPRQETAVRIFSETINLLLGGQSRVEGIGLSPGAMVVIETDGSIELSDMLTSAFEGAAATGLHVSQHSFADVLDSQPWRTHAGRTGRCRTCLECVHGAVCGGGLLPHRYRADSRFDNPSVYCADLYRVIDVIGGRLAHDLRALRQGTG